MGARGEVPKKFLEPCLFNVGKHPFLYKEGTEKGHFHSFAEKDRGPEPQAPHSCTPGHAVYLRMLTTVGT